MSGEEPLPAQVTVELEAEAGRTYTLSGVQECGYLFSGAGTVVLEDAVIAADEGFSAVTLADGAEVTVEISGTCMLTGGAGGAGIAVPASAVLTPHRVRQPHSRGQWRDRRGRPVRRGHRRHLRPGRQRRNSYHGSHRRPDRPGIRRPRLRYRQRLQRSSMAINITRSVIAEAVGGFGRTTRVRLRRRYRHQVRQQRP